MLLLSEGYSSAVDPHMFSTRLEFAALYAECYAPLGLAVSQVAIQRSMVGAPSQISDVDATSILTAVLVDLARSPDTLKAAAHRLNESFVC